MVSATAVPRSGAGRLAQAAQRSGQHHDQRHAAAHVAVAASTHHALPLRHDQCRGTLKFVWQVQYQAQRRKQREALAIIVINCMISASVALAASTHYKLPLRYRQG